MSDEEKKEQDTEKKDEGLAAQWASMFENQEVEKKDEDLASQWASMVEEKQQEKPPEPSVKPEFNLTGKDIEKKLELILDIPITISFEIGSRRLLIEDIIKLSPSSVVELDKYIDQPIDIKVNGVLVAKGELYQVEDNFAVKIVQIISKEERMKLISSQFIGG